MCGICGVANPAFDSNNLRLTVQKMMKAMTHRGPDQSGTYFNKSIGLGHQRLSIIGVETGQQPIFNEDGRIAIVFNGEIYNYLELKTDLVGRGHVFRTGSDTEVIIHSYEEYGEGCLGRLRGMFAFAIYDAHQETLFLARDRLGIKPLYYLSSKECFAFASEIKSFLLANLYQPQVNQEAIHDYLFLNYTIAPATAFLGIEKLPPGHWLRYQHGKITIRSYWDYASVQPLKLSEAEWLEGLEAIFTETTRMHLMSEVPLGAFLSGGIDSSYTVGIMSKLTSKPVKTFTVGYEGAPEASELQYAQIVAKHFHTEHHEFILRPTEFSDVIPKVLWHLDEPIAEYATIPLMLLSYLAKKHVTVMLSGEGADELLAGYPIYRLMGQLENYQSLPQWMRAAFSDPILSLFLGNKRGGKYKDWIRLPLEKRYLGNGSRLTTGIQARLYSQEFKAQLQEGRLYKQIAEFYGKVGAKDPVERMLYLDTKTWLPDDLLLKADKTTMAAAIELRVPFLDHKLVEFAASVPSSLKVRGKEGKYLLKRLCEGFLPREIIYRKKQGFPVPMRQWLQKDLLPMAKDYLLDSRSRQRGYFNLSYVEDLILRHSDSRDDLSVNIWSLLVLEMWHRIFIDGDSELNFQRRQLAEHQDSSVN
jgi:asparagine synthase (glutamine-hydrolysing)